MAIRRDKDGNIIYRPSVALVIATQVLAYITEVQADPEVEIEIEQLEWIISDVLTEPDCKWYSAKQRVALQKRKKLICQRPTAKVMTELNRLEKIIGHIPSGHSRTEIQASDVIQRAAARLRAEKEKDREKGND